MKPFAPEAIYQLKIDTDGDGFADIACRVRFSEAGDYRIFAGWREPFFFDTQGALNKLQFTGDDFNTRLRSPSTRPTPKIMTLLIYSLRALNSAKTAGAGHTLGSTRNRE